MVLKKDARAVLQFYPETSEQAVVIAQAASKVHFNAGVCENVMDKRCCTVFSLLMV